MGSVLIVILGLLVAAGCCGGMYVVVSKKKAALGNVAEGLEQELATRKSYEEKLNSLYAGMISVQELAQRGEAIRGLQESLKAERGRITITQAELETVETRLRELDEIERELEASAVETKEEIKILKRKEADLAQKNTTLKEQIDTTKENLGKILTEVQLTSEMQDQVKLMQTELVATEQKTDELLLKIEEGNEQYFILKSRYDALDIEYAQLYEKFAEAE